MPRHEQKRGKVPAKVTQQQVHALIGYYLKAYTAKYDKAPEFFNRHRERWGFESMATDLGIDGAKEIIDYYFQTHRYGHPSSYLTNNYDHLKRVMIEREKDLEKRKQLLAESKVRVEEWRNKRGD